MKDKLYVAEIGNKSYCMGQHYPEDDWSSMGIGETQEEALDNLAKVFGESGYVGSYGGIEMHGIEGFIEGGKVYIPHNLNDINRAEVYSYTRDAIIDDGVDIPCDLTKEDLMKREPYKRAKYRKDLSTAQMEVINQRKKVKSLNTEFENLKKVIKRLQGWVDLALEGTEEYHEKSLELIKLKKKQDKNLNAQIIAHDNLEKTKKLVEKLKTERL